MLVARVRAGDADAYAELVRRYAAVAHRTAVLSGAGAEAEDVVQVAFIKAYQNLSSFRDSHDFRPWLLRVVVNETRNSIRSDQRRRAVSERAAWLAGVQVAPDPASEVVASERQRTVLNALKRLSEPQRAVVICRYFLGLDERDSARVLDLPKGTVKSRLHRAIRNLRRELEGALIEVSGETTLECEVEHER